jgi:uncharacterized membrane protein YhaH (DUF805 family)
MIRRLRRRHRATWLALAVLVPILYAIALGARQPAPVVPSLPAPLLDSAVEETAP